jgi:glycosyltransferase involved in cell wall biosynthesis
MKIGHFSFSPRGGAGKVADSLHQHQVNLGMDSSFYFVNSDAIARTPFQNPGISVKALADKFLVGQSQNSSIFSFYRSSHSIRRYAKLLSSFDVVHFHWIPGVFNLEKLEFPINNRTKFFWSIHDMWPFTGGCHYSDGCKQYLESCISCPQVKPPFKKSVHNRFVTRKRNLKQIFPHLTLIYPSSFIEKLGMQSSMLKNFNSVIIGNPVEVSTNTNSPKLNSTQLTRLNSKAFKICFVATDLSEIRKGSRILLKWFLDNITDLKNVTLIFIGKNGGFVEESDNIIVIPNVSKADEMNYIYTKSDLHVSLSKEESFGYTIIESGLMQTPSVCFQGTAQSELIINGYSGYLINQIDELKNIIGLLQNNPLLIREVGYRARKEFAMKFNQDIIGTKFIRLYENQ